MMMMMMMMMMMKIKVVVSSVSYIYIITFLLCVQQWPKLKLKLSCITRKNDIPVISEMDKTIEEFFDPHLRVLLTCFQKASLPRVLKSYPFIFYFLMKHSLMSRSLSLFFTRNEPSKYLSNLTVRWICLPCFENPCLST